MDAIGIADRNTLAGVVRLHSAAKEAGLRPLIGCRLDLIDAPSLLAYPRDRDAYGRLSRLLSLGKMRAKKGECELSAGRCRGTSGRHRLHCLARSDDFEAELPRLREALPSLRHVAASYLYRGDDAARIERLDRIAKANGCTILATNDVHYHEPNRRPLQDVMSCIREKVTIANCGLSAECQCRAAFEELRGYGKIVRSLAASHCCDTRICRRAEFQPRRIALRISARDGAGRAHPAAASRASDLGRRGASAGRTESPKKCSNSSATSSS